MVEQIIVDGNVMRPVTFEEMQELDQGMTNEDCWTLVEWSKQESQKSREERQREER